MSVFADQEVSYTVKQSEDMFLPPPFPSFLALATPVDIGGLGHRAPLSGRTQLVVPEVVLGGRLVLHKSPRQLIHFLSRHRLRQHSRICAQLAQRRLGFDLDPENTTIARYNSWVKYIEFTIYSQLIFHIWPSTSSLLTLIVNRFSLSLKT